MNSNSSICKAIIIGDSAVGKSSMLLRYLSDKFTEECLHTIGIDFKIKDVMIDGQIVKLHIWDMSGQKHLRPPSSESYYLAASAIVFTYDIGNRESFENLTKWVEEVKNHGNDSQIKILVGTKYDTEDKQVTTEEARAFAHTSGCVDYFETSALTGKNVNKVFVSIANRFSK